MPCRRTWNAIVYSGNRKWHTLAQPKAFVGRSRSSFVGKCQWRE